MFSTDENVTWKNHIDLIGKKKSKSLGHKVCKSSLHEAKHLLTQKSTGMFIFPLYTVMLAIVTLFVKVRIKPNCRKCTLAIKK